MAEQCNARSAVFDTRRLFFPGKFWAPGDSFNPNTTMRRSLSVLSSQLTHFSDAGPRMVEITAKPVTERLAIARSVVLFPRDVLLSLVDADGHLMATAKVGCSVCLSELQCGCRRCHPINCTVAWHEGVVVCESQGDMTTVATIAGIGGVKATPSLIPLCHPISVAGVDVRVEKPDMEASTVSIECSVRAVDRTGAEMEALTGASVAALTVIDMCKAAAKHTDRGVEIASVRLIRKEGGRSGLWKAK